MQLYCSILFVESQLLCRTSVVFVSVSSELISSGCMWWWVFCWCFENNVNDELLLRVVLSLLLLVQQHRELVLRGWEVFDFGL